MECRICKKCGKKYPLEDFIKSKGCKNGRAGTCKNCQNEYGRTWKQKNRHRLAPIRRKQYAERYGVISRAKERERKLNYPLRRRAQVLRSGIRVRSKELNLPFDKDFLTVSYFISRLRNSPFCECCGAKLDIGFKQNHRKNNLSPSVDRKILAKGYTKENVALLCWRCNNLKRDATANELITIARWMESWGDEVETTT